MKVTKMRPRLRNKSYKERLESLHLFTLIKHRLQDVIKVVKTFKGRDNTTINK